MLINNAGILRATDTVTDDGRFASPHPDALDPKKCQEVVRAIEEVLVDFT